MNGAGLVHATWINHCGDMLNLSSNGVSKKYIKLLPKGVSSVLKVYNFDQVWCLVCLFPSWLCVCLAYVERHRGAFLSVD